MQTTPADWHQPFVHRGFSRAHDERRYVVRLSVLGSQRRIGSTSNQLVAAQLYDLALWKLAALIPRKPKPNFPDEFPNITKAMVTAQCPYLDELYLALSSIAGLGAAPNEDAIRDAALERHAKPTDDHHDATRAYVRFCKLVEQARNDATLNSLKVFQAKLDLNLAKLPELARLANEFEIKLDALAQASRMFAKELANHKDFYAKQQRL